MRGPMRLTAMLLVLVGLAGCAKSSAESAVATADKAMAAIPEEAKLVSPAQFKTLTDTLADVKARLEKGDYQSALMGARSITVMARDLQAQLPTQKAQLTSAFETAKKEVPALVDSVKTKIAELAKMRRLPPSIDQAKFAALQADAATWSDRWAQAEAAFQKGELAAAMSSANQILGKARDARMFLQM